MNSDSLRWDEKVLRFLLCVWAFLVPVTIVAQSILFLAIPIWVYGLVRNRDASLIRLPYFTPVVLFCIVAIGASAMGARPSESLAKTYRLLMFLPVFMLPTVFRNEPAAAARRLVSLFIGACVLLAVFDVARVALEVSRGVQLYDTGNMRDPQMYMIALCFLLSAMVSNADSRRSLRRMVELFACAVGLIIHFKRGSWFSFGATAVVLGAVARRRSIVLAVLLVGLAMLAVPQTRQRLKMLKDEWSVQQSGRYSLWTVAAPGLLREYPLGMGLCAVRHEDLLRHTKFVQPRLNHLHNNALQIALELGWAGVIVWITWMTIVLVKMFRNVRAWRTDTSLAALSLGILCSFCAIMINGLVEYNFGDSEIIMAVCLVMGLSALVSPFGRVAVS